MLSFLQDEHEQVGLCRHVGYTTEGVAGVL
jgi:hypothetical protein